MVEQQRQTMGQGKQSKWEQVRRGIGLCTKPAMQREGENPDLPVFLILNTWILNHQAHHPREPCFIFLPETQRSCHCVPLGQAPDNLQRLSALFCALLCQVLEEAVTSQGSHTQASAPSGLSLFSAPSPVHYCPQDQTVGACGRGLWKRLLDLTLLNEEAMGMCRSMVGGQRGRGGGTYVCGWVHRSLWLPSSCWVQDVKV